MKREINYLYFILTLLYVSLLSLSHILAIQQVSLPLKIFFSIYAVMQAILEVLVFILLGFAFKRVSKTAYKFYIGFLFLFLLAHFADYTVLRLMDTTIIMSCKIFFASGLEHFIAAIQALNLNLTMGLIILGCIVTIPLFGILFYLLTHKIIQKKPFSASAMQVGKLTASFVIALFFLDILAKPYLTAEVHAKYEKILPLKSTFLSPTGVKIPLENKLRAPKVPIIDIAKPLEERPNIYIFVIETLRKDVITKEIAPNLCALSTLAVNKAETFANANASQLSWFSIFHSRLPYHWNHMRKSSHLGGLPLKILKKMGYKIKVHCSADLRYFKMDELLFGKNRYLLDSFSDYNLSKKEPPYRDKDAMAALLQDIQNHPEATVFLIFLDSTHSEYSWAEDFPLKFYPITKEIDYLTVSQTRKGLDKIKNRYKNSVSYVDFLFSSFFHALESQNLMDQSLIVVTGDHGEEFFEHGALFHGTHLNNYQISVPILYKFPKKMSPLANISSHVDIFPTILHYLTNSVKYDSYFDGKSIFSEKHVPYVFTAQQNAGENPYEFSILEKDYKMIVRFSNPTDIYENQELEIISIKTFDDQETDLKESRQKEIQALIQKAFKQFLN